MNRSMQIGFSQRIQVGWLERTASLLLMGHARDEIQTALQELLWNQLSVGGTAERGNREKAISILLKIWVTVPKELEPFRDEGLAHLNRLPLTDHLTVPWGMTIAVYPFVGVVAEAVGRLLRLQGSCAAVQVQRRVKEQLDERETVARAARRILRCFINWGVLHETKKKGVYQATPVRSATDNSGVVICPARVRMLPLGQAECSAMDKGVCDAIADCGACAGGHRACGGLPRPV